VYLIHGSNANRSARRRAEFVIRYMPATSVFERADGDKHVQSGVTFSMSKRPIWLLRGKDRWCRASQTRNVPIRNKGHGNVSTQMR
jgi:hypothetical protein